MVIRSSAAAQIREPAERARRDAAAARLVARKARAIEQADPCAAERQRAGRGGAGWSGAHDENVCGTRHYFRGAFAGVGAFPTLIRFASNW